MLQTLARNTGRAVSALRRKGDVLLELCFVSESERRSDSLCVFARRSSALQALLRSRRYLTRDHRPELHALSERKGAFFLKRVLPTAAAAFTRRNSVAAGGGPGVSPGTPPPIAGGAASSATPNTSINVPVSRAKASSKLLASQAAAANASPTASSGGTHSAETPAATGGTASSHSPPLGALGVSSETTCGPSQKNLTEGTAGSAVSPAAPASQVGINQEDSGGVLEDVDFYQDHCCAVCLLPKITATANNPFFYCSRCGVSVHRLCYGVPREALPLHLRKDDRAPTADGWKKAGSDSGKGRSESGQGNRASSWAAASPLGESGIVGGGSSSTQTGLCSRRVKADSASCEVSSGVGEGSERTRLKRKSAAVEKASSSSAEDAASQQHQKTGAGKTVSAFLLEEEDDDTQQQPEPFVCEACRFAESREDVQCDICPRRGGALKLLLPTNSGWTPVAGESRASAGRDALKAALSVSGEKKTRRFAHMTCCLWAPGVDAVDPETLSPIVGVDALLQTQKNSFPSVAEAGKNFALGVKETQGAAPPSASSRCCSICRLSHGFCIPCSEKNCSAHFHVLCAQLRGCFLQMSETKTTGFCATAFCLLVGSRRV